MALRYTFACLYIFLTNGVMLICCVCFNTFIVRVDWKSLTIPACLPITTDYFPEQKALQTDYVVSLYNLLPDDVNNDYAQKRAIYRDPLTTVDVFKELISQRLSQGFQLIIMPNKQKDNTNGCIIRTNSKKSGTEASETYLLSIGRLFHKISLSGNSITVTRYRPRHPYPGFNYQYRYRFHAPHHDTYEESYSSFSTEKLEHYAWNYLDHYICTRGDADFELVDTLKYWRFRMYLLPLNNAATKRIIDGAEHCDIYELPSKRDHQIMTDGFLRFVETVVNKIKRPGVSKKPRMSLSVITHNLLPLAQPRRNSMSAVMQNPMGTNSPFRERLGSNRLPDRPRPRSGSKVMERGRVSPAVENQGSDSLSLDGNEDTVTQSGPVLKAGATNLEILEAMRNPYTGLSFLTSHQSFANLTFVSADAVNWLMEHVEGVTNIEIAVKIMNRMRCEGLIGHASGDFSKKFIYGFYLYCVISDKEDREESQRFDVQSFENEWLEVEVKKALEWGRSSSNSTYDMPNVSNEKENGVPHFLRENIDPSYFEENVEDDDSPIYKRIHLEMDISSKSDRVEWGHAKYQRIFRSDQAYELVVEWLIASGSIAAELLFGWYRKAQTCQLQLVPIPHDPLALPYSNKSDPLRGPIFIPLNIGCLSSLHGTPRLFKDFPEEADTDRLFLFQEAIIARFGFIQCLVEPSNSMTSQEYQYVHCTGTVFILVSCPTPRPRARLTSFTQKKLGGRYSDHADIVSSPHEAYITRHVSGKNKDDYDNTRKMGFLWSWNHMVSKRWRTNQAVDNNFQTKLLRDFREFCANKDNRLVAFWDKCWEAKETAAVAIERSTILEVGNT